MILAVPFEHRKQPSFGRVPSPGPRSRTSVSAVKSTSLDTENHDKNGYVTYKNFIMTDVDNNHDTKYTNKNDTNKQKLSV